MKRAMIAVAAVAFVFPGLSSGGTAAHPSLRLLNLTPPSLQGTHFKAGERVGITLVTASRTLVRTVKVSSNGKFTAILGSITLTQRCAASASLIALGTLGDRKVLELPRTGCSRVTSPEPPVTTGRVTSPEPPITGPGYVAPSPPYTT